MAKPLNELNEGGGMVLPDPVVTPTAGQGMGPSTTATNDLEVAGDVRARGFLLPPTDIADPALVNPVSYVLDDHAALRWIRTRDSFLGGLLWAGNYDSGGTGADDVTSIGLWARDPQSAFAGFGLIADSRVGQHSSIGLWLQNRGAAESISPTLLRSDGFSSFTYEPTKYAASGSLVYGIGGLSQTLLIGTTGQALTVVAGVPAWAPSPTSVLTTTGDILYASAANTLARLGIGSTDQVLTVAAGLPSWANGSKKTLTTTGDMLYASGANTLARLAVGTAAQLLMGGSNPAWSSTIPLVGLAATKVFSSRLLTGDTTNAIEILGDGTINLGPGGSTAVDVSWARIGQGATVFSAVSSGGAALVRYDTPALSNSVFSTRKTADANSAWAMTAAGTQTWGAGGGSTRDTTLSRSAAGVIDLGTTAEKAKLRVFGSAASDLIQSALVTSDANERYQVRADGRTLMGPGSAGVDVGFSRFAAGLLDVHDGAGTGVGGVMGIAVARNNFTFNIDSAEKTLLTFSVPAAALQTTRGLLFFISGDFLFNNGAPTLTLRVKYGATTMWGTASAAITLSATRRAFFMHGFLGAKGATNAQTVAGTVDLGDAAAGSVAGIGNFGARMFGGAFAGTATEDSTLAKTFAVTGQMSVSNVNDEMRGVATLLLV